MFCSPVLLRMSPESHQQQALQVLDRMFMLMFITHYFNELKSVSKELARNEKTAEDRCFSKQECFPDTDKLLTQVPAGIDVFHREQTPHARSQSHRFEASLRWLSSFSAFQTSASHKSDNGFVSDLYCTVRFHEFQAIVVRYELRVDERFSKMCWRQVGPPGSSRARKNHCCL